MARVLRSGLSGRRYPRLVLMFMLCLLSGFAGAAPARAEGCEFSIARSTFSSLLSAGEAFRQNRVDPVVEFPISIDCRELAVTTVPTDGVVAAEYREEVAGAEVQQLPPVIYTFRGSVLDRPDALLRFTLIKDLRARTIAVSALLRTEDSRLYRLDTLSHMQLNGFRIGSSFRFVSSDEEIETLTGALREASVENASLQAVGAEPASNGTLRVLTISTDIHDSFYNQQTALGKNPTVTVLEGFQALDAVTRADLNIALSVIYQHVWTRCFDENNAPVDDCPYRLNYWLDPDNGFQPHNEGNGVNAYNMQRWWHTFGGISYHARKGHNTAILITAAPPGANSGTYSYIVAPSSACQGYSYSNVAGVGFRGLAQVIGYTLGTPADNAASSPPPACIMSPNPSSACTRFSELSRSSVGLFVTIKSGGPCLAEFGSPIITVEPAATTTVAAGTAAELSFTAVRGVAYDGNLHYTWFKDLQPYSGLGASSTSYQGGVPAILRIENVDTRLTGSRFHVEVSATQAGVTHRISSEYAKLFVNGPPVITGQPRSTVVDEGATASFSVGIGGLDPEFLRGLRFQWHKVLGGVSAPVSGATGSGMTVSSVPLSDDGVEYFVVIENSFGRVTSNRARMTVRARVLPNIVAPGIERFTCLDKPGFRVTGSGALDLCFAWYFQRPGANTRELFGQVCRTQYIANTTTASSCIAPSLGYDGWKFSVDIRNRFGCISTADVGRPADCTKSSFDSVIADVPHDPVIVTDLPERTTVASGQVVTLNVSARDNRPLTFRFMRRFPSRNSTYRLLPGGEQTPQAANNVAAARYSFNASETDNDSEFVVEISNPFGTVRSKVLKVSVTTPPPPITKPVIQSQPQYMTAHPIAEGKSAVIYAEVQGRELILLWELRRPGYQFWEVAPEHPSVGNSNLFYQTANLSFADNGTCYRLKIRNPATVNSQSGLIEPMYTDILCVEVLPPVSLQQQPAPDANPAVAAPVSSAGGKVNTSPRKGTVKKAKKKAKKKLKKSKKASKSK